MLSGNYWNSFGESFDKSKGVELHPGSVFVLPAGHPHYTWTEDAEAILQVSFIGPGGVTFLNPRDDPRNKDGGRTGQSSDALGLEHLLRLCLLQPNHAMERTADRSAFTFCVAKTLSLRHTLAVCGRRSSLARWRQSSPGVLVLSFGRGARLLFTL